MARSRKDPNIVFHKDMGINISVQHMDSKWLANRIRVIEQNGGTQDEHYTALLEERRRREKLNLNITVNDSTALIKGMSPPAGTAYASTPAAIPQATHKIDVGDIVVECHHGEKLVVSRLGEMARCAMVDVQNKMVLRTMDRVQVVHFALGLLHLFNEEETLTLLAQQINKVQMQPKNELGEVLKELEDADVW